MITKTEQNNLITVGMPAFNGERYIQQALESILAQSYKNLEIIISDDNSIDNTGKICRVLARKDARIKYYRQKNNLGFLKNFNFVLKKAHGKYFMWAGNDDYWDTECVRKLYMLFQTYPNSVLAVCKFNNVFNNKPYNYISNQYVANGLDRLSYLIHYLKTRNLSYFYGLHKTDNLKMVGGYHMDSRPFFGSSDFLTIFKVLLQGPTSYTDEVLFFKRDTGYYTKQFDLIRSHNFSLDFIKKILRFLCFPLFYLYDLCFAVWYTLVSSFRIYGKIILICWLLLNYIKYNLEFFIRIIKGSVFFILGYVDKIFS